MKDCGCSSGAGDEWTVYFCPLHNAAEDLLAACKAFVEAWEKSHQLEKTDVALGMAKAAIEKAQPMLSKERRFMAKCSWCKQEMMNLDVTTCTSNTFVEFPNGTKLPSIKFESELGESCHDCKIESGGYHHPGCDMERCPKCGGQLISCGCLDENDLDDHLMTADLFGYDGDHWD